MSAVLQPLVHPRPPLETVQPREVVVPDQPVQPSEAVLPYQPVQPSDGAVSGQSVAPLLEPESRK